MKKTLNNKAIPFVELFAKVISFANILLFTSILPIKEYANYSYIIAIVLWASVLMDGGINSLIYNKSLKNEKEGINELYTGRLFLSIGVTVVIVLFFYFKNPKFVIPALLFSFITYFTSTSSLVKMLSRGLGYTKVDVIAIVVEPIFRLIVLLIIYLFKDQLDLNLSMVLFWYLLSGILAFIINKKQIRIYFELNLIAIKSNQLYSLIVSSLQKSKYYLLYYLMFIGLARIDVIYLETVTSKENLGTYSLAFQLYQVAQLFFFAIITSQFLKLYNTKNTILKVIMPLTVLAILVTYLLSPYIFKYLFNQDYNDGQFVLNILILALIPSVLNYYFIAKNNYENMVKINFVLILLVFALKAMVYFIVDASSIFFYAFGVIISELVLLLSFIGYKQIKKH